jgi:V/A-type H+/Na+-transporting ATPase subunit I
VNREDDVDMSTLLKPVSMVKIAVLGLKKYRQQVVSILQEMNVMQLEPISKEADSFLMAEHESEYHRQVSDQLLRIRGLINSLPFLPVTEKTKFSSISELIQKVKSMDIDGKIASLERQKDNALTAMKGAENNITLLEEFSFFPEDLNILHLSSARSFFGRMNSEKFPEFKKKLELNDEEVMLYANEGGKTTRFVVVVMSRFPSNAFASVISLYNVHLEAVPNLKGKPGVALEDQKKKYQELSSQLDQINNQLTEISKVHYSFLKCAEEELDIENKKLEVIKNLGVTKDTFAMEGWIPKSKLEPVKAAFLEHSDGTTRMYQLETKETPPTLLDNPKRLKNFESFIRFYSLPSGNEFDPTALFGLIFPIFYGMMLGDVGYGLVILLVSRWVIRRIEGKKRNLTIMPKGLRKFGLTILQPVQMVKLAKAMTPGCIVAIVLGVCFDLYFGFHLNSYLFSFLNNFGFNLPHEGALLDPISTFGLRKLLLVSGYVGIGMVTFGLVLGIINSLRHGEKKHMISKLGWLLFGWGIVLIGLAMIGKENINPMQETTGLIYFALVFGGVGLMLYGEGVRAIMELPSIISHILSFTRLVGILLASVILADVIDFVFLTNIQLGIPYVILGVVIFFVGHIFNIVLGVFEPGIQGARLLYVEFLSKFYHGNGRYFKPFGTKRRFTYDQYSIEK